MARTSYAIDAARAGQARTAAGLTQEDAAAKLGINRITLNKIENGRTNVSLDLLERIASFYGRSREWMLGEPETIDEIELGRERLAVALTKISEGFEELTIVLNQRVRDAQVPEPLTVIEGAKP